MKYFYIITNETKDPGLVTTNSIKNFLMKRGNVCYIREEHVVLHTDTVEEADFASEEKNPYSTQTRMEEIPPEVECVIVLGGDGTLLRAARNLVNLNVPFLGINLGTLGYLTEGDKNSLTDILERVIADEYILEERMMIYGRIISRDGQVLAKDVALNDLTVNRSRSLRIFKFKLYVNGEFLYLYTADGIIISTPTGSTAYNLSCGGPVVEPTAKLFLVTPIAPHSLNNRSLILSSDDKIELEIIGSDKDYGSEVEYVAYFDGDSSYVLQPGCRIEITRAKQETKILKLSSMSFLDTLRIKMS